MVLWAKRFLLIYLFLHKALLPLFDFFFFRKAIILFWKRLFPLLFFSRGAFFSNFFLESVFAQFIYFC